MHQVNNQIEQPNDQYKILKDDIDRYRKDGHILLKSVATKEEIEKVRPNILNVMKKYCTENRPINERDQYGKAFLQVMNMWLKDQYVMKFSLAKKFAKIAADLMEVDCVRLYYDIALFKEVGGGNTSLHIDPWIVDTEKVITMWIALVDLPKESGTLSFITGSHTLWDINKSPQKIILESIKRGFVESKPIDMQAGDATFHSGWLAHSAKQNKSNVTREAFTITYFADGAYLMNPEKNEIREDHLIQYFPGKFPGELAEGPFSPIVYSRCLN